MKRQREEGLDIIVLDGRIDQDMSEELEALLDECVKDNVKNICIDMIEVKHICSSALGVLVAVKRRIKDHEGDIKLVLSNDNLLKLFQTTMLDKVFEIYESVRECRNSFD
ncbi:MAG TPA: STAS domain-containing protein [Spirochaetota bacterium]|jgi:anti-anti-sigma factor|nr:STAS domain-containing protein [Spirochaetota bacterium]HOH36243.1 STAS domain-containing protein [Spirochaetota bacterium]HPJ14690.1 STAS domain-containing protein [Spirochaetota bacterium]HPM34068.1 STAS domain-containing protein [Spirochaetota bacterium]HPY01866.1 STAS domain-containing protein [Spirochaetota bacterium]